MKKSLLALAALSAFATAAQAQSSVSVYGILDASSYVVKSDASTTGKAVGFNSNTWSTSRLGFKGSEDLGGGLSAVFNLESELKLESGVAGAAGSTTDATKNNQTFNRLANVGLSSNKYGSVLLGMQATPVYAAVAGIDAMGSNSGGLLSHWVAASGQAVNNRLFDNGSASTLTYPAATFVAGVGYTSPTFMNTTAKFFMTPGGGTQTASNNIGQEREGTLTYSQNNLNVVLGYGQHRGSTTSTIGYVGLNRTLIGANYTLGQFKLTAARAGFSYDVRETQLHTNYTDSYGVTYQATPALRVGTSYTVSKDDVTTANKASTVALSANYDLSKRTALYAIYTDTSNKGAAQMSAIYSSAGAYTAGSGDGKNSTGYAVGLRHSF